MKGWTAEHVRLAQAAIESRDALRRLATKIQAEGADHPHETLATAQDVAVTCCDLLRLALKNCGARRHRVVATPESQPIWQ
jgi:hypothetical protein